MALNINLDLTGILENILIDQKGKKQKSSIKDLRALLLELGAIKGNNVSLKKKMKKKK